MTLTAWTVMAMLLMIGLVAGYLMHRSDFCMAGAFRDIFLFSSLNLIRPLILLVTLSAVLFEICHLLGVLPYYPFPWFAAPSLVNVVGGVVFGTGMVLAGGCVVGVLYKLGSGNLLAVVALLGLLTGSALYAEYHPWWISLGGSLRLPGDSVTLSQWLGLPSYIMVLLLTVPGGYLCWRWWKAGHWVNRNPAEGFIPLWLTAVSLAGLGVMAVIVSGLPLGVTTSYAKAAAWLESLFVPDHVAALSYFTATPIAYALPLEGVLRAGGAGPQFDIVALVQVPLILGIVVGSWFSSRQLGEFHIIWKVPARQVAMVFTGGVIMALGARMTPGCNVWHLWGGLPLLTMQSLLFVGGLLPGAWLGVFVLKRVLVPSVSRQESPL